MTTAAKPKRKPKTVLTPEEFRAAQDEAKSEDQWQAEVIEYLQGQGWMVTAVRRNVHLANGNHTTPLQGNAGYVDLTCAQAGRVAFLELKGTKTKLEVHQVVWLNALAGTLTLTGGSLAWWDADHEGTPNYAIRGNETGWDVLVAVVRPRHELWVKATFAMGAIT